MLMVVTQASLAQGFPVRKPGLWEISIRSEGEEQARSIKVLQCTDRTTDAVTLMSIAPGQENCRSARTEKQKAGGYRIRTSCFVHEQRVETVMQLKGDLSSRYEGRLETRYPTMPAQQPGPKRFEGQWTGDCRTGMRPGDMLLPNGVTVNVVDDRKRAETQDHKGHNH